jgi:hypothetical protein
MCQILEQAAQMLDGILSAHKIVLNCIGVMTVVDSPKHVKSHERDKRGIPESLACLPPAMAQ